MPVVFRLLHLCASQESLDARLYCTPTLSSRSVGVIDSYSGLGGRLAPEGAASVPGHSAAYGFVVIESRGGVPELVGVTHYACHWTSGLQQVWHVLTTPSEGSQPRERVRMDQI